MTRVLCGAMLLVGLTGGTAIAQEPRPVSEWCRESGRQEGARHCDVREYTLAASPVRVDAGSNGGVRVVGWQRPDTLVRARVVATADTDAAARALYDAVQVTTDGGEVRATGPSQQTRRAGWHVSYEVWTPSRADISAKTTNGGISFTGVHGQLAFDATNGGVTLDNVGGTVRGHTVNGGLTVNLTGDRWDGDGLDIRTTNGGVRVHVPEGYSCQLAVATVNGGVRSDFPITMQGRLDRRIEAQLGSGGAPVRIQTTNGGVTLSR